MASEKRPKPWAETRPAGTRFVWRFDGGKYRTSFYKDPEDARTDAMAQITDQMKGTWRDRSGPKILLEEWIDIWVAMLDDIEPTTRSKYKYFVEAHILPEFQGRQIGSLTFEEIEKWEKVIPTRISARGRPYARSVASGTRPLRWALDNRLKTCSCQMIDGRPACKGDDPTPPNYLFLGPRGGHPRRSNYADRYITPAAEGIYPSRKGVRRPVYVLAEPWPGIPITKGNKKVRAADLAEATWPNLTGKFRPHDDRHTHATWPGMGRIASDASLRSLREHALPAAQASALPGPHPAARSTPRQSGTTERSGTPSHPGPARLRPATETGKSLEVTACGASRMVRTAIRHAQIPPAQERGAPNAAPCDTGQLR